VIKNLFKIAFRLQVCKKINKLRCGTVTNSDAYILRTYAVRLVRLSVVLPALLPDGDHATSFGRSLKLGSGGRHKN
jgi:hypothetical protein